MIVAEFLMWEVKGQKFAETDGVIADNALAILAMAGIFSIQQRSRGFDVETKLTPPEEFAEEFWNNFQDLRTRCREHPEDWLVKIYRTDEGVRGVITYSPDESKPMKPIRLIGIDNKTKLYYPYSW